jgi:hypothetical protein
MVTKSKTKKKLKSDIKPTNLQTPMSPYSLKFKIPIHIKKKKENINNVL